MMQCRQHELDMPANYCSAPGITGSDIAHEARRIVKLPAEASVSQFHFERFTRHRYPLCQTPLTLDSIGASGRREASRGDRPA
jgi:hypothetical protein